MPPFRRLPDHELERLDDDALIAHVRAARRARDRDQAVRALQILVYGHWANVEARMRMKLPEHAVEDETSAAIFRAVKSSFDGQSVGEFRSWLRTIVDRAIADFYRDRERRIEAEPLPGERGEGDEEPWRGAEPAAPGEEGYVEAQSVIEQALGELNERHRQVVEMIVFDDRPAAEAAAAVESMTVDNAYQIVKRFRDRVRELLEDDTG